MTYITKKELKEKIKRYVIIVTFCYYCNKMLLLLRLKPLSTDNLGFI